MAVVITGASSGIGKAFAERYARDGNDVVLIARRRDRLDALARDLRERHGVAVDVIPADLSDDAAADRIAMALEAAGTRVDVLVNNAGFGVHADVADSDPAALTRQVQVNCSAVVAMTTRFLPGMLARRSGTIINVGSTASFQPVPHMAVYGASKAFVLSFTEALWEEVRGSGVRVIALCPGATETEFFETAGEAAKTGRARGADDLVDHCLRSLATRKPSTVHGFENALVARVLPRLVPRRLMAAIAGRATGLPAQRSADAVAG